LKNNFLFYFFIKMPPSLDSIIDETSGFINSQFNLKLEKSQRSLYTSDFWKKFYETNNKTIPNFKRGDEGVYTPADYCAHVLLDSPLFVSNMFHEYFGHGLFCEHSKIGKDLVEIIQNNGDKDLFLYGELDRIVNPVGLTTQNIANYEGFAMWLEELLCEETGYKEIWQLKKEKKLHIDYVKLFEFFKDAEQKLSRFGFMSQLGFPKYYDNEKVIDTLRHFYNGNFSDIDFIILYGSQKPESDIDLFVVSEGESENLFNGWLDLFQLNRGQFEDWVNNLDISITDPLFSGKLIYGDRNYFESLKERVIKMPIDENQIQHNLSRAEKEVYYLQNRVNAPREEKIFQSYIKSYTIAAEELSRGNKILTLQKIKEKYKLF